MPSMTLEEFARHLDRCASQMPRLEREALRITGARLRQVSRDYLGEYQGAVGPFPAWAPLSEFTIQDRTASGYPPDEPLLRKGDLRASIAYMVVGREMTLYSNNPIAAYQEFGTPNAAAPIPPRAFIGRAVAERGRAEALSVARAALRPLMTGRV